MVGIYGFTCPHCRTEYHNAKATEWVGRRIRCAKCRRVFRLSEVRPRADSGAAKGAASQTATTSTGKPKPTTTFFGKVKQVCGVLGCVAFLLFCAMGRLQSLAERQRWTSYRPTLPSRMQLDRPQVQPPVQRQLQNGGRPRPEDVATGLLLNALAQQQQQRDRRQQQGTDLSPPVYAARQMPDVNVATPGTPRMPNQRQSQPAYWLPPGHADPGTSGLSGGYGRPTGVGGFSGSSTPSISGGSNYYDRTGGYTGSSTPNVFGGRNYYGGNSGSTGYSKPNVRGGSDYYDGNGRSAGSSTDNLFGGRNYYNSDGGSAGYSKPNLSGGYDYYDGNGRPAGSSSSNIFGGQDHHGR